MPAREEDASLQSLAFSVDTHLLRELGALLVGRDSTALVELIKNAYDADATRVTVHGESLRSHGTVTVSDDGHGMTYDDFVTKFLRIAGRSKESGQRRSPRYARKFTGAKGIGRLSSHKLGERLALESTPDLRVLARTGTDTGFQASIDWPEIERSTASIDATRLITAVRRAPQGRSGTLLSIGNLHSTWSTRQLNEFLAEVRSTRPDPALYEPLPRNTFDGEALLASIRIADSGPDDPGFHIEMSGAFAGTESQWPTLLSQTAWVIEIDARDSDVVRYRITPSLRTRRADPEARQRHFVWERKEHGPRFTGRIFQRDPRPDRGLRDILGVFEKEASGVRLFLEGFRVLPYGTPRNDWLGIDRKVAQRSRLDVQGVLGPGLEELGRRSDERTYRLANNSYFGAVFLHDATSHGLQMVVNREGFLPGTAMDQITDIVSRGIDISTRLRAALGAIRREAEIAASPLPDPGPTPALTTPDPPASTRAEPQPSTPPPAARPTPLREMESLLASGRESVQALQRTGVADQDGSARHAAAVENVLGQVQAVTAAAADEQAQLRVLASLGTQLGAFVHEVNGVLGQANTIYATLDRLIDEQPELPRPALTRLRAIRRAQAELVTSLERQAVYLADSIGAEARRRRSRQKVGERWETAVRLLGSSAERRNVLLVNTIPSELRSPPMFAAELNVILTNLLSNAIKAAARGRRPTGNAMVEASGEYRDGNTVVRVQNTGDAIDLADSERWFRPFETTTAEIDESLGQGLGLGLSLTRRIIEEYGGEIHFTAPTNDMSTAVSFWLPNG